MALVVDPDLLTSPVIVPGTSEPLLIMNQGSVALQASGSTAPYFMYVATDSAGTWGYVVVSDGDTSTFENLAFSGSLVTSVTTPVSYPYNVDTIDYFIAADTTSAAVTINLNSSPNTGQNIIVKDVNGNALINNVTVNGNGNNIDGSASFTINTNYQSVTLIFNGTEWSVI